MVLFDIFMVYVFMNWIGIDQLTSLANNPRSRSFTISQGIGNFIETLNALRIPINSVRTSSIAACAAKPNNMLRMAHPATLRSFILTFPRLLPDGRPASPCAFTTTAAEGVRISNRKNSSDGSRKNRSRTAAVPNSSTRSGGCDSTRVVHVM